MEKYCELNDGCLTVRVPRELDHHEAGRIKMEADLLMDAYRVRTLVFDFADTEFMDSSGIGVVIGRCRNMEYHNGEVYAKNLSARLEKIFLTSGLHRLVQMDGPRKKNGQERK